MFLYYVKSPTPIIMLGQVLNKFSKTRLKYYYKNQIHFTKWVTSTNWSNIFAPDTSVATIVVK
jgi:hypothetical protein